MSIDVLTVGVGFASFGIFLIIHFITFRWMRPEELLKFLRACVLVIAGLPLMLMGILLRMKAADASLLIWILSSLLALSITGLLSLVYVLCVFGPYETSVRMRLVREIGMGKAKGISPRELAERYNPEIIMKIRLRRLMGSGDIIEKDGRYHSRGEKNFFFLSDFISGLIRKWIGR